jgi:hypothetical protein
VVELAIGAVVFVTIILAGIFFAEMAQLSLKVQDAQTFAVWEASGRQVLEFRADGTSSSVPFSNTVDPSTGVAAQAQARFANFDGLSSSVGGGVVTRALTRGSAMRVTCERVRLPAQLVATPSVKSYYRDLGTLECFSSATVQAVRTPRVFFEFGTHAALTWTNPIEVCGTGFAVDGSCRDARLAIVTGDWGYWGPDETAESPLHATTGYSAAVGRLFKDLRVPSGAANRFAATFAGGGPPNDEFQFSYRGEESSYQEPIGGDFGTVWNTGGPGLGMVPFTHTAGDCFLGRACP